MLPEASLHTDPHLNRITGDGPSRSHILTSAAKSDEMEEMLPVADMLLPGTRAHAWALVSRWPPWFSPLWFRPIWLSHSHPSEQHCVAVLVTSMVSGDDFTGWPSDGSSYY